MMTTTTMYINTVNVGLSMIARNAENVITRAITSAKPYVHQIVVIDTGSDDRTASVAMRLGAEVAFSAWNDDFSEARNTALRVMRTEWILSLDADEELMGENFHNILPLCQNPQIGGIRLPIENLLHDGTTSVHTYPRLFRRSATRAYSGAIHEQIAPSLLAEGLQIVDVPTNTPAIIRHYGYAQQSVAREQRNARLLQKALHSEPESGYLWYHTGLTAFARRDTTTAEHALTTALRLGGLSPEQASLAQLRILQLAMQRNDYHTILVAPPFDIPEHEGMRLYLTSIARLAQDQSSATTAEVYNILASPLVAHSPFVPVADYTSLLRTLERSFRI